MKQRITTVVAHPHAIAGMDHSVIIPASRPMREPQRQDTDRAIHPRFVYSKIKLIHKSIIKQLHIMEEELDKNAPEVVENSTPETPKKLKKDDDDDFSWAGCLVTLAVVVAIAWALIHFNPSEEKHMASIAGVTTEALADGYVPSMSAVVALSKIKYHSLGIVSWTTVKYHGKTRVSSIGAVGFVYPLIEY